MTDKLPLGAYEEPLDYCTVINDIGQRFLKRECFQTEEAYLRTITFFNTVRQDILAFNHVEEIQESMPPLLSFLILPRIDSEIALLSDFRAPAFEPFRIAQDFDKFAETGWLLTVERILFYAKMAFNLQHWGRYPEFGLESWMSMTAEDFSNCYEDAEDEIWSWSLTQGEKCNFHVGRIASIARLDSLSAVML